VKEFGLDTNKKAEIAIPTAQGRDILLDAWRGISVLLVIFYHMVVFRFAPIFRDAGGGAAPSGPFSVSGIGGWLRHQTVRELGYAGPLGVQIFFVISGYIITKLMLREHQRNGQVSLAAFYVRRAFRILPPLWLMLAITSLLTLAGDIHVAPKSFLMAASFTCNTQPTSCGWFTGHTWSVATEEQFYLFWPLLLTVLGFRFVARAAFLICILFITADQFSLLTVSFLHNALSGACVAAGALFASSEKLRWFVSKTTLPFVMGAAVLLFAKPFLQNHIYGLSAVTSVATPLLIVIVIFSCSNYRGRLENLKAVRALSAIGLVSYGLYLWQEMFLGDASSYLRGSVLDYTPVCVLIVLLSYFLVEVPLMRVGARFSKKLIARGLARSAAAIAIAPQASI
jgi:peptidoglycan/LPS O-acetylase OafA/YrhL